ncbi:glycosyltransferase family 10 domain-containing protein [Parabacteroides gordonii]|uniref:glycosyltransferase family 10 domain-containing protein n=1 Tax=Parabacteroides gordonii TaxID=574930 RepID=UPI0026EAFC9C|nr:glycosyltransferase family 10 [Parabacteroides gordonii]
MKKKIRCHFTDFWNGFNYKDRLEVLLSEYEVVPDEKNPDYLFYSCFGMNHLKYDNCIKIFCSGENLIPDLNLCDYAVSLSDIQSGDRILDFNYAFLWLYRKPFIPDLTSDQLLNRKFCNFVYSNNYCADPMRERFYNALSKYKRVDAGGAFLNNMGGRVGDKRSFLKEYKFTIAIENSSLPGYSTEKILDPFLAQSLPIYWGDPNISSDYNPNSFVNLMDYNSPEEAIEEIIRLDNDDASYLEKVTTPFWPYGSSIEEFYESELERMRAFFRNIFEQPLEKARRRTGYGCVKGYFEDLKKHYFPSWKGNRTRSVKNFVKKVIRRYNTGIF